MFTYPGSKSKLAHLYQSPTYPLIIEPFAGSARYALRYADREVWLNDYWYAVCDAWEWLISASKADILAIPEFKSGDNLKTFPMSRRLRNLLRFQTSVGHAQRWTFQGWAYQEKRVEVFKRLAMRHIDRIRHWKVTNLDYRELPDVEATWFVDPPYQRAGHTYEHSGLDYASLGDWCKSRRGQVIVCENSLADWLPFRHLTSFQGGSAHRRYEEVVWYNN